MRDKFDVHQSITDQIVATIEAGAGTWTMPWQRSGLGACLPKNALSGATYNGINVLSLWAAACAKAYPSSLWATYKQWNELGAQVRKGEKSSLIVFYKQYETDPNPDNADDDGKRRVARASYVFNAAQVDGFDAPADPVVDMGPIERQARADDLIARHGISIRRGGDMACYAPASDHIQLPDDSRFNGTDRRADFYSVLWHEVTHWTGIKSRLDRDMSGRFGSNAYAMEELVAELGAAFLCAELGISSTPRIDHAAYIDHWLKVMKADNRAIFSAAAKASEAAKYILSADA